MPRKPLLRSDYLPYHVTLRTNNRELFPIPIAEMWNLVTDECHFISICYGAEIQSLVLMPNHLHMILTVPEYDLGKVMNIFVANVTKRTHQKSRRSGHVFGGPYHWSFISHARYFTHVFKYVYRNPVRGGLCAKVEDYPYSTLRGLLGFQKLDFPLFYTRSGVERLAPDFEDIESWLGWLNMPFSTENEQFIRRIIGKREIKILKDHSTRRKIATLDELI